MRLVSLLIFTFVAVTVSGQRCQWYGGASCCPELVIPANVNAETLHFVTFLPRNADSERLDNMCYTRFPVPEDPGTYVLYTSRVYADGSNYVDSFVVREEQPGALRTANAQCMFTDVVFDQVRRTNPGGCNIFLIHRCRLAGECRITDYYAGVAPIFGISSERRPIRQACLIEASTVISNNGLPRGDFQILPMRLPSRCVTQQICSLRSARQQLQQIVQYPTILG